MKYLKKYLKGIIKIVFGAQACGQQDLIKTGRLNKQALIFKQLKSFVVILSSIIITSAVWGQSLLFTLDNPNGPGGGFGFAMQSVGDVNGDFIPDILVGASIQDVSGNDDQGQAYVFSGANGTLLYILNDPQPQRNANFGGSVAGLGDVTADGVPDIVVGATKLGGQAFVFSGVAGTLLYTLDNPDPGRTFFAGAQMAGSIFGAGDLNGDSLPDIIVGSYGGNPPPGRAYTFSGASGDLLYRLDDPNPVDGSFGHGVRTIGDVNGDSIPDLLVGAWEHDNVGQAFVFSGNTQTLLYTLDNPSSSPMGSAFSRGLAGITDINGDTVPDVVIGALGQDADGNESQGRAFVFSGKNGSLLYTLDNPIPQAGANFGRAIADLGDIDNDSVPDLAVAASGQDATYVFSGADGSLLSTLAGGGNVIAVGDVNGDSRIDVAVESGGRVFVYKVSIIVDNEDAAFSSGPSAWNSSQFIPGGYNNSYQYAPPGDGSMWARWSFTINSSSNYEIFAQWTSYFNRPPAAPYKIINNGTQISSVTVDQTINGGRFISLGTYYLEAGALDVVLNNTPDGYVVADAVQIEYRGGDDEAILSRVEIEGPDSVDESSIVDYYCRAYYSDDTNALVPADSWTDTCSYATIDTNGRLEAYNLISNEQCRITANYAENGINKSGIKDITIIDSDTPEIVIDNEDTGFSSGPSAWSSSQFIPGGYNNSYQYAPPGDGSMWAKWRYDIGPSGNFEVYAYWTAHENRSTKAPYIISCKHYYGFPGPSYTVTVDQTVNGGKFISLGTYSLYHDVEVELQNTPTGYVIADAIKLVRRGSIGISPVTVDNTEPDFTISGDWGTSSVIPGYYGTNYMYACSDGSDKWAKWTFVINDPYDYDINAQWTEFDNRSATANYSILNNGINRGTATVDQTQNGGRLNILGTFYLESGNLEVILHESPNGCVIADAVQIVPR